jgi:hypothetical protein
MLDSTFPVVLHAVSFQVMANVGAEADHWDRQNEGLRTDRESQRTRPRPDVTVEAVNTRRVVSNIVISSKDVWEPQR